MESDPSPDTAASEPGLRVLVVDDNEDAAVSLSVFLDILGCETAVAFRGLAAMRIASEFEPDLAIIDLDMPDMNGCETALALHERPATQSTVCVCLTGYDEDENRQRCADAGFERFINKPMDYDTLQQTLDFCRERLHGQEG